jgi:hypothetical protein
MRVHPIQTRTVTIKTRQPQGCWERAIGLVDTGKNGRRKANLAEGLDVEHPSDLRSDKRKSLLQSFEVPRRM